MQSQNRLDLIDLYRGLAILSVAFFHYTARLPQNYLGYDGLDWSFAQGWVGVHFFFMISGFCILMTLEKSKNTLDFIAKRFARIYPTFLICLMITYAFIVLYPIPESTELPKASFKDFVGNFVLGRDLGFRWVSGVYWSLLVELKYYLFIAILFSFFKKPILSWLFFCAVGIVMYKMAGLFIEYSPKMTSVGQIFELIALRIFIVKEAAFFGLGMCFYRIYKEGCSIQIIGAVFCFFIFALLPNSAEFKTIEIALFIAMIGLFSYFLWRPNTQIPRPLLFIGAVSYPMYLIHEYFGYKMLIAMNAIIPSDNLNIAITLIVMVIFAYLIHILIEFRFNQWAKDVVYSGLTFVHSQFSALNIYRDKQI